MVSMWVIPRMAVDGSIEYMYSRMEIDAYSSADRELADLLLLVEILGVTFPGRPYLLPN